MALTRSLSKPPWKNLKSSVIASRLKGRLDLKSEVVINMAESI